VSAPSQFLDSPIEYLKGVGPVKGDLLRKELSIFTFRDLLFDFPFRYIDKTRFHSIGSLRADGEYVQIVGYFTRLDFAGTGNRKRLNGRFEDKTGAIEIVWFRGIKWQSESLKLHVPYLLFGKTSRFKSSLNIVHPEVEMVTEQSGEQKSRLDPVYRSTEKLNSRGLDSRGRRKLAQTLIKQLRPGHVPEVLSDEIVGKLHFESRFETIRSLHFPADHKSLEKAVNRYKFEELFFMQLNLLAGKLERKKISRGAVFKKVGNHFHHFFNENLAFELTNAQKRVIKEIRRDVGSGKQMNRLLQGDVGSGKTIVALMCMLIAIDNGCQCCMMAPTEILAQQHYRTILTYLEGMNLEVAFLSGSIKGSQRKEILEKLKFGAIDILVGTHALLEKPVQYHNLGFAVTDEQHRFGVEQRAKLWQKGDEFPPHILVMTATPIPRTLAMTVYGDLDVSVIDELPPGRKTVKTIHRSEAHRPKVISFMKQQISVGRQIYVIYPLIEESEKLDLQNLQEGYEALLLHFPKPKYQISVVHGKMKSESKEYEMSRFASGVTHIMVATTVIEVGVNVQNATVMVIENAERFGLSQLHQLRGRVGRGADQSYCLLMTSYKQSKEAKERIRIMCDTSSGFEIAEADLRLRGPGEIAGTKQSGVLDFKLVNLAKDTKILNTARYLAETILKSDPSLSLPKNQRLLKHLSNSKEFRKEWYKIS
jgi:ATP-dependent DNA helicase RecG